MTAQLASANTFKVKFPVRFEDTLEGSDVLPELQVRLAEII